MPNQTIAQLTAAALAFERRFGGERLKRGMLAMFAGWIAFFLLVNVFIRPLNRLVMPFLDLPVGVVLVAQGTVVVFVVTLYLLAKKYDASTAA